MAKKNRLGLSVAFLKLLLIVPAIFSLTGRLVSLAQREIRLLRKKIILLIILAVVSLVLLLSIWVYGNILLLLYLLSVKLSLILSIALMMTLNLLFLTIVCLMMALI